MNSSLSKQQIHQLLQENNLVEASRRVEELCRLNPEDSDAWLLAASIHARSNNITHIIKCCTNVIRLDPDNQIAHYNLAIAYQSSGELSSAKDHFTTTLRINPDMHAAKTSLGYVLHLSGQTDEAIELFTEVVNGPAQNDSNLMLITYTNLSLALCSKRHFIEAEYSIKKALAIKPDSESALNNLGQALKEQGKLEAAAEAHKKAAIVNPEFFVAHSNYLLDLNYLTSIDNSEIFSEHCKWAAQLKLKTSFRTDNEPDCNPDKQLRIGYVSPDFRAHSVILFIANVIESHDREKYAIYCYSDTPRSDTFTEQIKKTCDIWRDIHKEDNEQLADIIAKDNIDILVDLAGHTANNRLPVFAAKPAPVQASWLGYPNTTGLQTIDYRLTDEWADPPGDSDETHTETLVRLPGCFLCYQPLAESPHITMPPIHDNGSVTFGSLNNSAKINTDVIELWCRLLKLLPDSKLILKSPQLADQALQQYYLEKFVAAGIDKNRVKIYGHITSTIEHLSIYNQIDIALDPFPYNGTTTTCEALWMGVPVVTLAGDRHSSRVGTSLLNSVGLNELVAEAEEDYIQICKSLADDTDRLDQLRSGMRDRLQSSQLLDKKTFTNNLETAYRQMWTSFCDKT